MGVRLAVATAAAVLASAVLAAAALAAVGVSVTSTSLRVVGAGEDRDYDIVVEPYKDVARTGYRIRPRVGESTGPIETSDSDCLRNGIVNDVVCGRFATFVEIDLEDGGDDDRVALREQQPASELGSNPLELTCRERDEVEDVDALVYLGAGDDSFAVVNGEGLTCADSILDRPHGVDIAELEVYGGSGNDVIDGHVHDDTLSGGNGSDEIEPRGGADTVIGGSGNDMIRLSTDYPHADFSRVEFAPDVVDGGDGFDTVVYSGRTKALFIDLTPDTDNDGEAGERDTLLRVEKVIGGSGSDTIKGAAAGEELSGRDGADRLEGLGGDDVLWGQDGADLLIGGNGDDELNGGAGDDTINARDLRADVVSCGTGGSSLENDRAEVDLEDTGYADCETVVRYKPGFGPPARVRASTLPLRRQGGTVSITLECPASERPQSVSTCSGTLAVTRTTGASLASATYSVGLPKTYSFQAASWPEWVTVTTTETGTSGNVLREEIRKLRITG